MLEAEGLTVHISADGAVDLGDDLEQLGYVYANSLTAAQLDAYQAARSKAQAASQKVRDGNLAAEDAMSCVPEMLRAELARRFRLSQVVSHQP